LQSISDTVPVIWIVTTPPVFSLSEDHRSGTVLDGVLGERAIMHRNRIVVGNGNANELVFMTVDGDVNAVAGGDGEGPGEFRNLQYLALYNDTVLALDGRLNKISLFSLNGRYHADIVLGPARIPILLGAIAGSGLVTAPFQRTGGLPRPYTIWNWDGHALGELAGPLEYEHPVVRIVTEDRQVVAAAGGRCLPVQLEAILDSSIFIGDSGKGEVLELTRQGVFRRIYASSHRAHVTDEMLRRFDLFAPGHGREAARSVIGDIGGPLPSVFARILPDATGHLWLERASCMVSADFIEWEVIDTSGRLVAVAQIPSSLRILAVEGTRILVMRRDLRDVEFVELYDLRRDTAD
jgi:hypothetical protein